MEKLIIPSILVVSDVVYMADKLLKISEPLKASDPKLEKLHLSASDIFNRMVKSQKQIKKSLLTEESRQFDKDRDRGFISFRDILHGMSISLIPEKSEPATQLYALIENYGTQLYNLGYKAESSMLKKLFNDFDQDEKQQWMTELGILPYYTSLKTVEVAFAGIDAQRSEEKTLRSSESEPASEVKEKMITALSNLMALMQLNNQLEPEIYGETYSQMVIDITAINATARARNTRKDNNGEANESQE